jgi:hypothetical protein
MKSSQLAIIFGSGISGSGTKRTDWVGVIMSVDWGRVEAVGGAPNRRS